MHIFIHSYSNSSVFFIFSSSITHLFSAYTYVTLNGVDFSSQDHGNSLANNSDNDNNDASLLSVVITRPGLTAAAAAANDGLQDTDDHDDVVVTVTSSDGKIMLQIIMI